MSATELAWWRDAFVSEHAVAGALAAVSVRGALAVTAVTDRAHAGDMSRLHPAPSALACPGGAPVRYADRPVDAGAAAACRLEDALVAYRPFEELSDALALERSGARREVPVFARLAGLRRSLLAHAVHAHVGAPDLGVPAAAVERALDELARWVERAALSKDERWHRAFDVERRRAQLHAIRGLVARPVANAGIVGCACVVEPAALRPWLTAAAESIGVEPKTVHHALLKRARRFPCARPRPRAQITGGAGDAAFPLVDRVDALLAIYAALPSTPAVVSALLTSAEGVLGHVLRDPAVLRGALHLLAPGDAGPRRAVVVALGLLGEHTDLEVAAPDPGDAAGAEAYVLAAALTDPAREPLLERLDAADRRARGAARDVTAMALRRARAGNVLTVIG